MAIYKSQFTGPEIDEKLSMITEDAILSPEDRESLDNVKNLDVSNVLTDSLTANINPTSGPIQVSKWQDKLYINAITDNKIADTITSTRNSAQYTNILVFNTTGYITDYDYSESLNIVTSNYFHSKLDSLKAGTGINVEAGTGGAMPTISVDDTVLTKDMTNDILTAYGQGSVKTPVYYDAKTNKLRVTIGNTYENQPWSLGVWPNDETSTAFVASTGNLSLDYHNYCNLITAKWFYNRMNSWLTAGTGIKITPGTASTHYMPTISCTLDTEVFKVVTELPTTNIAENKIYLVPNSSSIENNIYDEWLYVDDKWEKVGESIPEVNLSDYYTKTESDSKFLQELPDNVVVYDSIPDLPYNGSFNIILKDSNNNLGILYGTVSNEVPYTGNSLRLSSYNERTFNLEAHITDNGTSSNDYSQSSNIVTASYAHNKFSPKLQTLTTASDNTLVSDCIYITDPQRDLDYTSKKNLVTANYVYDKFVNKTDGLTTDNLSNNPVPSTTEEVKLSNGTLVVGNRLSVYTDVNTVTPARINKDVTGTYTGIYVTNSDLSTPSDYSTSKNLVTASYAHNKFALKENGINGVADNDLVANVSGEWVGDENLVHLNTTGINHPEYDYSASKNLVTADYLHSNFVSAQNFTSFIGDGLSFSRNPANRLMELKVNDSVARTEDIEELKSFFVPGLFIKLSNNDFSTASLRAYKNISMTFDLFLAISLIVLLISDLGLADYSGNVMVVCNISGYSGNDESFPDKWITLFSGKIVVEDMNINKPYTILALYDHDNEVARFIIETQP